MWGVYVSIVGWMCVCVWGGSVCVSICGWMYVSVYVSIFGWMCRDVCVHEWGGLGWGDVCEIRCSRVLMP